MQRWRFYVLAALVAGPVLVLISFGMVYMWQTGLSFWLWWPLSGSLVLAWYLGWRWMKKKRLLGDPFDVPQYWTERDHQAWALVEARVKDDIQTKAELLTDFGFYAKTAESLATELARFYHPKSKDLVGSLTVPEILAVVELAAHDLRKLVDQYLPGGHLLTINDMRRFKKVVDWYPTASNITWLISTVFAPLSTAVRYFAVQGGMNRPWQMLQDNLLFWFYTAYVHRLGSYLIDLNSGRLRVGVERFLKLKQLNRPLAEIGAPAQARAPADAEADAAVNGEADPADEVRTVTFILVGQTKAGKSSLINALLGEQRAVTDVIPATAEITRYELQPPDVPSRFQLLDTVGYSNAGPRGDQKHATEEAARDSDLILLVLHARDPARQADLNVLEGLNQYFAERPNLRKPPVLAVLTHIDLLSPSLEWKPPYDWQNPQRPKEQQINQAVQAVKEQLGSFLVGVVPVCTAEGKVHGIQEWLLPALVGLLDQAHAVAFLRCLKAEANTGKVRKVFHQLLGLAKQLGQVLLQGPTVPR